MCGRVDKTGCRASPSIALDLSRLLTRAGRSAPTGIDRVELAYARHFIARSDARLIFVARAPPGGLVRLPAQGTADFVTALNARWRGEGSRSAISLIRDAQKLLLLAWLDRWRVTQADRPTIYLLISHQHLDRPGPIARL